MVSEQVRENVERVHGIYAMRRPLYRAVHYAIRLASVGLRLDLILLCLTGGNALLYL